MCAVMSGCGCAGSAVMVDGPAAELPVGSPGVAGASLMMEGGACQAGSCLCVRGLERGCDGAGKEGPGKGCVVGWRGSVEGWTCSCVPYVVVCDGCDEKGETCGLAWDLAGVGWLLKNIQNID